MRFLFVILLFLSGLLCSGNDIVFYREPPDLNTPHVDYEYLRLNGIYELSYKVRYKSLVNNKYDTLIWVIKKWNDSLMDFVETKKYYKDSITHTFVLFDEEIVKEQLLKLKKYKKYKRIKDQVCVEFTFNPFKEVTLLEYNLSEKRLVTDSIITILRDSISNLALVKAFNFAFNDTAIVQYQYDYSGHSGRSYEYFRGKKYLRSVITLNMNNQVTRENIYMFDYLTTDYKTMMESNPYQSHLYEYADNNLVKSITLLTPYSEITYLHDYK